jgi:uncharacterized membrane protein
LEQINRLDVNLTTTDTSSRPQRLMLLDIARGVALAAMAIYHFTWDLEYFGYAEIGTTLKPGWIFFARSIASSFLFLVGVGLWLAHSRQLHLQKFLFRLAKVTAAAVVISLATWFAMPQGFIFFGILHSIALGSVLALPLLRLPWLINAAIALFFIIGAIYFRNAFFDEPWWYWTGLSATLPHSNDYEPVFPWFGVIMLGVVAARLAKTHDFFNWLAKWNPANLASTVLAFLGRHSLATYLIHQPLLFGMLYGFVAISGGPDHTLSFVNACEKNCRQSRDARFCQDFCTCVADDLKTQNLWNGIHSRKINITTDQRVKKITRACLARDFSQ